MESMRSKIGAGERDEQAARVYGSTFTVLPCWFWRRSRGWARNGRAVKASPTALRMRGLGGGVCYVCVQGPIIVARTHRKKARRVRHPGAVSMAFGNEARMSEVS